MFEFRQPSNYLITNDDIRFVQISSQIFIWLLNSYNMHLHEIHNYNYRFRYRIGDMKKGIAKTASPNLMGACRSDRRQHSVAVLRTKSSNGRLNQS